MSDLLWQSYAMKVGQHRQWPIGDALFHVLREEREWRVARQAAPGGRVADSEAVPPWRRWPANEDWTQVRLAPAMPDRPVVVRPENPVILAPGSEALFFVSIPIWVCVTVEGGGDQLLADEPAVILSGIWHGEPTEGEICYALKTRARRADTAESSESEHRAVCKVRMINETESPVEFQRLCLQVKHVKVYAGPHHLWTDAFDVAYPRGTSTAARVVVAGRPDEVGQDADVLAQARVPSPSGHFWQKGMGVMKSWI